MRCKMSNEKQRKRDSVLVKQYCKKIIDNWCDEAPEAKTGFNKLTVTLDKKLNVTCSISGDK
jgi:hypothetical protein